MIEVGSQIEVRTSGSLEAIRLRVPDGVNLASDEGLLRFSQDNPELHVERTPEGEIIVMAPAGGESSRRNAELVADLVLWARLDGTGIVYDSSVGFVLPDGSLRSPDAAWVRRARLAELTPEQKERFLPLCPDFVVELRSPTDALVTLQAKMEEYRTNGARLGWLLDPTTRQAHLYRPDQPAEILDDPTALSGEEILPGFTLDLTRFWDVDF